MRRSGKPEIARKPVLGVVHQRIDCGVVRHGDSVVIPVDVSNWGAGGEKLQVSLLPDPRIAWAVPANGQVEIAAGARRTLGLALRPTDDVPIGVFEAALEVTSPNSVGSASQIVTLCGQVVEDIHVVTDPQQIALSALPRALKPVRTVLTVTRSNGQPVRVGHGEFHAEGAFKHSVSVEWYGPSLAVDMHTANREPGSYVGTLMVHDADENVRPAEVPVSVSILPPGRLLCEAVHEFSFARAAGPIDIALKNDGESLLRLRAATRTPWLKPSNEVIAINPAETVVWRLPCTIPQDAGASLEGAVTFIALDGNSSPAETSVTLRGTRERPVVHSTARVPTRVRPGRLVRACLRVANGGGIPAVGRVIESPEWLRWTTTEFASPAGQELTVPSELCVPRGARGRQAGTVQIAWTAAGEAWQEPVPVQTRASRPGATIAKIVLAGACLCFLWLCVDVGKALVASGSSAAAPGTVKAAGDAGGGNRRAETPVSSAPVGVSAVDTAAKQAQADALLQQASELKRHAQYREALSVLVDKVKPLEPPQREYTYWLLGWIYSELGQRDKAREAFTTFGRLSVDPDRKREAKGALDRLGGPSGP